MGCGSTEMLRLVARFPVEGSTSSWTASVCDEFELLLLVFGSITYSVGCLNEGCDVFSELLLLEPGSNFLFEGGVVISYIKTAG